MPTDTDILNALRQAYFNLATSGAASYTIFGRTFTRLDMKQLQDAIVFFERRIDALTQPGIAGGTLLAGFGEPT